MGRVLKLVGEQHVAPALFLALVSIDRNLFAMGHEDIAVNTLFGPVPRPRNDIRKLAQEGPGPDVEGYEKRIFASDFQEVFVKLNKLMRHVRYKPGNGPFRDYGSGNADCFVEFVARAHSGPGLEFLSAAIDEAHSARVHVCTEYGRASELAYQFRDIECVRQYFECKARSVSAEAPHLRIIVDAYHAALALVHASRWARGLLDGTPEYVHAYENITGGVLHRSGKDVGFYEKLLDRMYTQKVSGSWSARPIEHCCLYAMKHYPFLLVTMGGEYRQM